MDTIVAQATANGRGGVGIVRVSGDLVTEITAQILGFSVNTKNGLTPRRAELLDFLDEKGEPIDNGIALFFPNPNSFTGEDVLELQAHGGPVVMDLLMRRVLNLGARAARAGEFSERAFLNGKMDLLQAEAIADLIESGSEQAARSALRSLQGEFSKQIQQLVTQLIELRLYVESAIDFPEEEIDFLKEGDVAGQLQKILNQVERVLQSAEQGALLREGMTIVIAGQPNAGKSSLLNLLAAKESAIVTDIPGTTRDLLKEQIEIDGLPIHIIDTAGLRESSDLVEIEGIRRSWQEIEQADLVLLLIDDQLGETDADRKIIMRIQEAGLNLSTNPLAKVFTKTDLSEKRSGLRLYNQSTDLAISVKTEEGMKELREFIKERAGYQTSGEGIFLARARHLNALQRASASLQQGQEQIINFHAGELLAEELRQAQNSLSEITGEFTSDDLLGEIFSSFCIGK
ncbi:MAG: tRNA uridine-5-carboxymethylaminomethyl(34) synthesis GTPase MnmE [Thiotrichales bacterium]|nr:tRNA uridine-5-carboxymethylaminomethyl(34) synthesis GTPase MnmE [Thiotrichales bacterium]MBT3614238.1 tRNA uridine-5-carboxymethylaminomethyl(34) synthesis GTPase MnmE [Thiotrichales bacterium]MBT3751898.1 tRNA uridine-5-carboxymethylaminomethyl(34) synthesis GTPase MnmE [Thiotrichales bacterium]MBT3837156.1 tRNA uridine-5-carboxymethylaminomethyl(34) synthesis GTPase MnmE [Thiotrichales bacterium]MBT4153012.1 tRNA uridine-5-carboxymethylaminomethyl(34) synthesis GTPase MnmE [Thiotrichales